MVEAGCDVIEVGLPYTDPVMDGPTIQAAAQQALEAGTRTADVLRTVEAVAATGVADRRDDLLEPGRAVRRRAVRPRPGERRAAPGLITPDLIPDEAGEWVAAADAHGLDKVFLVAPSSTDARLAHDRRGLPRLRLRDRGHGRHRRPRRRAATWPAPLVARTRAVTDLPVGVGLGVSNGDQAAEVAALRRRRDRRLGVRPPAARRRRRPGRRPRVAGRADPRPRRRGPPCVGGRSPSVAAVLALLLAGCGGPSSRPTAPGRRRQRCTTTTASTASCCPSPTTCPDVPLDRRRRASRYDLADRRRRSR